MRVGQLEEQVRQLNGKIEQLQYANKQLEDKMAKFQQDVEFRFQELGHKGKPLPKRSDLSSPDPSLAAAASVPPSVTASAAPRSGSHDDAFDPSKDPNAPGVPRTLGSAKSGAGRSGQCAKWKCREQRRWTDHAAQQSAAQWGAAGCAGWSVRDGHRAGNAPGGCAGGFTTTPGGTVIAMRKPIRRRKNSTSRSAI